MKRKIISINQDKCNGCGLCMEACHEGAIEIKDGKAKLIKDSYCDGLGDCLPACPEDAIEIVEREAEPFDAQAVKEHLSTTSKTSDCCPAAYQRAGSLKQWPIQLHLVPVEAEFFENAHLLIAADCTAFACQEFHKSFLQDRILLIACPKLDNIESYRGKLQAILQNNQIQSVTILRMTVPCCTMLTRLVQDSLRVAEVNVPLQEEVIGLDGSWLKNQKEVDNNGQHVL